MMRDPKELLYSKSHEWIDMHEDGTAYIGLTDYAQKALGDIVFVNLPEEGDEVTCGESFADVESVKAVSDVYSPLSGVTAEINEEILDAPEEINNDPYGAWFIKVRDITEKGELISLEEYEGFVETLDD